MQETKLNVADLKQGLEKICIRLSACDDLNICAESNYSIGINLLGQPFAEILLRGVTKFVNCGDKKVQSTSSDATTPVIK